VSEFTDRGSKIRQMSKELVLDFMRNSSECKCESTGLKQSEIFRLCGFDWGAKKSATSSSQQSWFVALLRELEESGLIARVSESGPWRVSNL
jgi:hypothetical protein